MNGNLRWFDCRFLLKEAFLAKSMSYMYMYIARKYFTKLRNDDNSLHKPEIRWQEPGQTDRQTNRPL